MDSNMALLGEGGVPMRSMGHIGWGFGKISQETWEIFLALLTCGR